MKGWIAASGLTAVLVGLVVHQGYSQVNADLDTRLKAALDNAGFTGKVESTLPKRLGRPVNQQLANLGRLIFFDKFMGLHEDNSCAACHSPRAGFNDSQSIAIGVDSLPRQPRDIVGPNRKGARNQRRTPTVVNTAFYPRLMYTGRFFAISDDPFDNSKGFGFPEPEGEKDLSPKLFKPNDPQIKHLLVAQAHIPFTELPEMAGFTGISGKSFKSSKFQFREFSASEKNNGVSSLNTRLSTGGPDFGVFDDGHGVAIPGEEEGYRNFPIRVSVLQRLNSRRAYRAEFAKVFPAVKQGKPITFPMIGQALAEFQISLTRANAPIDRYARGQKNALSRSQKNGALIFFTKGKCVTCHSVRGAANEMFSDFKNYVLAVPQIAPEFGVDKGNVAFRGDNWDEDFGFEDTTGDIKDRYKFRTAPLRNVGLQPTFFHNGAFTKLEDAIQHHLDVRKSLKNYDAAKAGVAPDLRKKLGPSDPMLERLDPLMAQPITLSEQEFRDLTSFVRFGLLDPRANDDNFRALIPAKVPSGMKLQTFHKSPGG